LWRAPPSERRYPNPLPRKIIVVGRNGRAAEGKNKKTPETNLMIWSLRLGGPSDRVGSFAPQEVPELFAAELRRSFRRFGAA